MAYHKEHQNSQNLKPALMQVLVSLCILGILAAQPAQAQTFTVLHTFTGTGDGHAPYAGLTLDRAGNLYGTTTDADGPGTVFQMKLRNGSWVLNTLHTFSYDEGIIPLGGVVFGPNGSLYGTTSQGGTQRCDPSPCGTVYNLRPPAQACSSALCPWDLTVLYQFHGGSDGDGAAPGAVNPIFDAAGNLYGTTVEGGGIDQAGTVFAMSPSGGGWTEKLIHTFTGRDGEDPYSGVIIDPAGNLYGTTQYESLGNVYQMVPSGSGWTLNVLYSFHDGADGSDPMGTLIMDRAGNLYGTTSNGGAGGGGTVYELSPSGEGWTYALLYSLSGRSYGGPQGPLAMDSAGNLYGTAVTDGPDECGLVFKLTNTGNGWAYTDLHDFTCRDDGSAPYGGVVLDSSGNLYGTAAYGGMFGAGCSGPGGVGCGVVFEITP